jgi:protein-disulfide isomerase
MSLAKDIPRRRDFLLGFLTVACLCSLLLNAVLVLHISYPSFWRDLRVSRLHPPAVRVSDHVRGRANAPVTIIEYADFQCPYCRQMHASLLAAVNEGTIRWVYREYPMGSIHSLALQEAEAAECAAEQGKFWEYADALFAAQSEISSSQAPDQALVSLAQGVSADPAALEQCLGSGQFTEKIKSEMGESQTLEIRGTPTIFINDKRREGFVSYEDLTKWLQNHPT